LKFAGDRFTHIPSGILPGNLAGLNEGIALLRDAKFPRRLKATAPFRLICGPTDDTESTDGDGSDPRRSA
jgi:hypothetical protein